MVQSLSFEKSIQKARYRHLVTRRLPAKRASSEAILETQRGGDHHLGDGETPSGLDRP
jgi:hypothetical protein